MCGWYLAADASMFGDNNLHVWKKASIQLACGPSPFSWVQGCSISRWSAYHTFSDRKMNEILLHDRLFNSLLSVLSESIVRSVVDCWFVFKVIPLTEVNFSVSSECIHLLVWFWDSDKVYIKTYISSMCLANKLRRKYVWLLWAHILYHHRVQSQGAVGGHF